MNEFTDVTPENAPLREIKDVMIDTSIPRQERIRDYVRQIGNPYRYLDDGVVVEIGYADTKVSLQDRLLSYANNMDRASGKLW
jgi:hypothetical protein